MTGPLTVCGVALLITGSYLNMDGLQGVAEMRTTFFDSTEGSESKFSGSTESRGAGDCLPQTVMRVVSSGS
jgi:hypothetical protein